MTSLWHILGGKPSKCGRQGLLCTQPIADQ